MAKKLKRPSIPRGEPTNLPTQLPNAPLAEVIFELRWALQGKETPDPFRLDPGYYVLASKFGERAKTRGFEFVQLVNSHPTLPAHSIERRFTRSPNDQFPLIQTGPGIFAVNDSTNYEWDRFRKFCMQSVCDFFEVYPVLSDFAVKPISLELRYLDAFNNDSNASRDVIDFLERDTFVKLTTPKFVPGKVGKLDRAALALKYLVSSMDNTSFNVNIGNGTSKGAACISLQSKVITLLPDSQGLKPRANQIKFIGKWLNNAHDITSPFFKEFVRPHLMQKFTEAGNAGT